MAYYSPKTRNGHNMFVMASMLQKALRRADIERAGYAAYEMFGSYDSTLWKRLLVVSAEDCWGVLTKEIVALQKKHSNANVGLKGYDKKCGYTSVAVSVLSDALKSRDACYYSCNFIMSDNPGNGNISYSDDEIRCFSEKLMSENQNESLMFKFGITEADRYGYMLYRAIENCDMENSGYALKYLTVNNPALVWKVLYAADHDFTQSKYSKEIDALLFADEFVNKKKIPEDRDPLFISKAIMIMMYDICGKYHSLCATPYISLDNEIDHTKAKYVDIRRCTLDKGIIPQYVFDVHTIEGKRAGHTDWEMNIVENDALSPMQKAFFEEGSWELRYDYKHRTGICTEGEYLESLEYRKNHLSNPAPAFICSK